MKWPNKISSRSSNWIWQAHPVYTNSIGEESELLGLTDIIGFMFCKPVNIYAEMAPLHWKNWTD